MVFGLLSCFRQSGGRSGDDVVWQTAHVRSTGEGASPVFGDAAAAAARLHDAGSSAPSTSPPLVQGQAGVPRPCGESLPAGTHKSGELRPPAMQRPSTPCLSDDAAGLDEELVRRAHGQAVEAGVLGMCVLGVCVLDAECVWDV